MRHSVSATNLLKTDMENGEQNTMFTGPFILTKNYYCIDACCYTITVSLD